MPLRRAPVLLSLTLLSLLAGCDEADSERTATPSTGGNPAVGAMLIRNVGCGACHTIPGIRGAHGVVGPPLYFWARRTFIAGQIANSPENLVRWIRNPPSMQPGTAMPALGLSEQDARDMAAYLYTLR